MNTVTVSRRDDRLIAVKQVEADSAAQLEHEAEVLGRLRHPGVVRLFAIEETAEGGRTLHTEFVSSETWATRPLSVAEERAAGIATLAATVADLHDLGIAHTRISADHVLHGEGDRPVLCGLSRAEDATPHNRRADTAAVAGLCHDDSLERGPLADRLADLAEECRSGQIGLRDLARHLQQQVKQPPPQPVAPRSGPRGAVKRLGGKRSQAPHPNEPVKRLGGELPQSTDSAGPVEGADRAGASERLPPDEHSGQRPASRAGASKRKAILGAVAACAVVVLGLRLAPFGGDSAQTPDFGQVADDATPTPDQANDEPAEAGDNAMSIHAPASNAGDSAGSRDEQYSTFAADVSEATTDPNSVNAHMQDNPTAGGGLVPDPSSAIGQHTPNAGAAAASRPTPDSAAQKVVAEMPAAEIVEHQGRSYAIGVRGDLVALGDWDCDGVSTPAIVRPSTGSVALSNDWPAPGQTLSMSVRWRVESPVDVLAERHGDCNLLRIYTDTGSRLLEPLSEPQG